MVKDLPSASREVLEAWTEGAGVRWSRVAIVLDVVIGLPSTCWPSWATGEGGERPWSLFARAAETPGWGRPAGERFFETLRPRASSEPLPRRHCEREAGANSVFVTRPFQKNVQTGTFRVWKDLAGAGGGRRWANVWAFDRRVAVRRAPWIFEGYPSLLWAEVFGHRRRAPARFGEVLSSAKALGVDARARAALVRRVAAAPDVADAAVLALGAACLDAEGRLMTPFRAFGTQVIPRQEGWIAGLARSGA